MALQQKKGLCALNSVLREERNLMKHSDIKTY